MKKVACLGLALGLVGAATAATTMASELMGAGGTGNPRGNIGGAGIVGSSHDLSGVITNNDGGDLQKRICVFCHHPHNSLSSGQIGYSPLWNRGTGVGTNSATGSAGSFIPYNNSAASSSTTDVRGSMMGNASSVQHMMNGTPAFGGVSLLCMSCHDGVTAMNAYSETNNLRKTGINDASYSSKTNGGAQGIIASSAALAKNVNNGQGLVQGDMSNHHPVGMNWDVYDVNVGRGENEIAARTSQFITKADITAAGGLINLTKNTNKTLATGNGRSGKQIQQVLSQGKMECVTCHDVHNSGNEAGAERFLWVTDDNSAFCLSCHLK